MSFKKKYRANFVARAALFGHRLNVNDGSNFSVFTIFLENSHFIEHSRRRQKMNSEPWAMKNLGMVRRRILLSTDWETVTSSNWDPERCLSLNFWGGTFCSPPSASFPADGNKANKEIDSIFQNIFTSARLFLQQEKTTSWGLLQHLERSDSIPYIFMLIGFSASKMSIYLKGHFHFKKLFVKGFRAPLTLDYITFPLTPESQNAQSRISKASFYFVFPWILLPPQSPGLLPQDSTGEGLANSEHIWRPKPQRQHFPVQKTALGYQWICQIKGPLWTKKADNSSCSLWQLTGMDLGWFKVLVKWIKN